MPVAVSSHKLQVESNFCTSGHVRAGGTGGCNCMYLQYLAVRKVSKAELPNVAIVLALNFLPWEFLLIKKLEIERKEHPVYNF